MVITIESFYDPNTETYIAVPFNSELKAADYETEAETVIWKIDSLKADSLTLKETADKAAQLAVRHADGTYTQAAFNKAYAVAFACVHCTGYQRNGVSHPAITWDQATRMRPGDSVNYPLLDDAILTAYMTRATTFLLTVRPKQREATNPSNNTTIPSDSTSKES